MGPSDSTREKKTDWAWRYAKTCAQVSDWARHELTVHLTDSHFMEEAIIVAANRTIPMDHIVFRILQPHWYKTLSVNAAARATLVPQLVKDIIGWTPEQTSKFVKYSYENFNFVGNYVPNQLQGCGFPSDTASLDHPKYKNYPYDRNMILMWDAIRKYVHAMLLNYNGEAHADIQVAEDQFIAHWSQEIQSAAHITTFPTIKYFQLARRRRDNVHSRSRAISLDGQLPTELLPRVRRRQASKSMYATTNEPPTAEGLHRARACQSATDGSSATVAAS